MMVADLGVYDGGFPLERPSIMPADPVYIIEWDVALPDAANSLIPSQATGQITAIYRERTATGDKTAYYGLGSLPAGTPHFWVGVYNASFTAFTPAFTPESVGGYTHGPRLGSWSDWIAVSPIQAQRSAAAIADIVVGNRLATSDPTMQIVESDAQYTWDQATAGNNSAGQGTNTNYLQLGAGGIAEWGHQISYDNFDPGTPANNRKSYETSFQQSVTRWDLAPIRSQYEPYELLGTGFGHLGQPSTFVYGLDYEDIPGSTNRSMFEWETPISTAVFLSTGGSIEGRAYGHETDPYAATPDSTMSVELAALSSFPDDLTAPLSWSVPPVGTSVTTVTPTVGSTNVSPTFFQVSVNVPALAVNDKIALLATALYQRTGKPYLSTTNTGFGPERSGHGLVQIRSFYVNVLIQYPRYRYWIPGLLVVPPLRHRQRTDGLLSSAPRAVSVGRKSKQRSTRSGWEGTYL